jgi:CBS-domain-containing membrane protein
LPNRPVEDTHSSVLNRKEQIKINPVSTIKLYLNKMRCSETCCQPQLKWGEVCISSLGSLFGIGPIALISMHYNVPLLIPSFGASAALLYATCHMPMAQPRNVLGGHVLSALSGVITFKLFGNDWWAVTLAVVLAIALMMVTRTLHPPGGATAFVAVINGQDFSFIILPVALGAAILILVALIFNNLVPTRKYPQYWL